MDALYRLGAGVVSGLYSSYIGIVYGDAVEQAEPVVPEHRLELEGRVADYVIASSTLAHSRGGLLAEEVDSNIVELARGLLRVGDDGLPVDKSMESFLLQYGSVRMIKPFTKYAELMECVCTLARGAVNPPKDEAQTIDFLIEKVKHLVWQLSTDEFIAVCLVDTDFKIFIRQETKNRLNASLKTSALENRWTTVASSNGYTCISINLGHEKVGAPPALPKSAAEAALNRVSIRYNPEQIQLPNNTLRNRVHAIYANWNEARLKGKATIILRVIFVAVRHLGGRAVNWFRFNSRNTN